MRQAMRILAAMAALFGAGVAGAQAVQMAAGDTSPVDYAKDANWICRPGVDDGTCSTNLDAMAVDPAGKRSPAPWHAAKDPPVDCFYVYPTVSLDPTMYAGLDKSGEVERAVHGQLARLGAKCRLFAPVYHQLTMTSLRWNQSHPGAVGASSFAIPYRDIAAAWRDYLARDNKGRGVVLIGHSQGAVLLKKLIQEEIDDKPTQKLLLAAYLAGNPNLDESSFKAIPPCRSAGQTGCVVAWSSYLDTTVDGPRYFGHAGGAGAKPICVNPAAIAGGEGKAETFLSKPRSAPDNDPPYNELVGQLTVKCVADDKGAVLAVHVGENPLGSMLGEILQRYTMSPGWGLHVLDISLVQGNIIDLIGSQSAAWAASRR